MKLKNIEVKISRGFQCVAEKNQDQHEKSHRSADVSILKIVSADEENKHCCRAITGGCEQKITSALQENSDD